MVMSETRFTMQYWSHWEISLLENLRNPTDNRDIMASNLMFCGNESRYLKWSGVKQDLAKILMNTFKDGMSWDLMASEIFQYVKTVSKVC